MLRHSIVQSVKRMRVGVVGAPFNKGQTHTGVKEGPTIIRQTGFIDQLRILGNDVVDTGDVHPEPDLVAIIGPSGELNHNRVMIYNEKLAESVKEIKEDDRVSIMLGGDHCTGIGSLAGHSMGTPEKQVVCLWVDAHPDINTGRTSPTGNMHGIVPSYLLNDMRNKVNRLPGMEFPKPFLESRHLAYIGLRESDPLEKQIMDDLGILYMDMKTIDKIGVSEGIARCMDRLKIGPTKSLHVSFDIDSLDPLDAPSTGTAVRGGLTLREGLTIVEACHETGELGAIDVVEVNPNLGSLIDIQKTADAAKYIILGAISG